MKRIRTAVVLAVVALVAFVAASAAIAESRPKQRVAITIDPARSGEPFVLVPLTPGRIALDKGSVAWQTESQRMLVRNEERIRRWVGTGTFDGENGTLVIHFRIDWRDAGRSHEAGWGTWRALRGTGSYAGVSGSGTSAHVWVPRGPISARLAGLLRSR